MAIRPKGGSRHWLFGLLLVLGLAACANDPTPTPSPGTGYTVLPQFESFYAAFGGAEVLGEPLTGACETGDGRIVQYLQRLRLDSLPEQNQVMVYPLGEWALGGVPATVPAPVPADSEEQFFPATGYAVQDEFLSFYEQNEGDVVLGPPISPQLGEGELRVQYFRNGRLEWHPDAPPALRVRLGPLGQAHYLHQGSNRLQCDVLARPVDISPDLVVEVDATVKAPVLYTGDEQVVFAKITTPTGQPVAGLAVRLSATYHGETFAQPLGETDKDGNVSGPLTLPTFVPGEEVAVEVSAAGPGDQVLGESALTFKTWW